MKGMLLVSLFISSLYSQSYLIEVKLKPRELINFSDKIDFVLDFDDLVLAKGDREVLSLMLKEGIAFQILDTISLDYGYYIIWDTLKKGLWRELLRRNGYCLVKAKEAIFAQEVYRIPLTRIHFKKETPLYKSGHRDTLIVEMVGKVSQDSIINIVRRLQAFRTRYSFSDSARACAEFLREKFLSYGLDSVYFHYFSPFYAPNVIGIKKGEILPDNLYVVLCGHFDSISDDPYNFAPGADDNGSGTASILEAIRVMKDYEFRYTIRFIAFSGEEQGLVGSYHYCSLARYVHEDSIIGVINVDMVAYSLPNRDSASIIGKPVNPNCEPLVDYFISCANTYTNLKCQRRIMDRPRSDHASFNRFGYLAIHIRENLNVPNPYYHTTGDTIGGGFNDLNLVYEVCKASIATAASLAQPISASIAEETKAQKLLAKDEEIEAYNIFGQKTSLFFSRSGIYFIKDKKNKAFRKVIKIH